MHQNCESSPLLIFSHMRWNDTFHRPHQFSSRFSRFRKVYFIEEPIFADGPSRVFFKETDSGVIVVMFYIEESKSTEERLILLKKMLNEMIQDEALEDHSSLYFTPIPWNYSSHLTPAVLIYDCLDQNLFDLHDPQEFDKRENELIQACHLMTTHSYALYHEKQFMHPNFHLIQNSVDYQLFSQARNQLPEPEDQARIRQPKIGYYGKIDDRLDYKLIDDLAKQRPDYQFIFIGPIAVSEDRLPKRNNIHYLGKKNYYMIPSYIAHWNCAILPFEENEHTKFLNPIKIKELLAAGVPVISTPLSETENILKKFNVIQVGQSSNEIMGFIHKAIINDKSEWITNVDRYLIGKSWTTSFLQLAQLEKSLQHPYKTGNLPAYKDESLISIGIV